MTKRCENNCVGWQRNECYYLIDLVEDDNFTHCPYCPGKLIEEKKVSALDEYIDELSKYYEYGLRYRTFCEIKKRLEALEND